jgi:hypothetical protein
MKQSVWDQFEDGMVHGTENTKPFPFINHEDKGEVLDWLERDIEEKIESKRSRLTAVRRLDALYKGLSYTPDITRRDTERGMLDEGFRQPKVFVNFVNEMVEAKVAQRSRFAPSIAVIPQNDEVSDENNAELAKIALTAKAQEMDFETVFANGDKINFLTGESATYIHWNKDLGGSNALYMEKKASGITLSNEDGSVVEDVPNGDIDIKVLGPDRFFYQLRKTRFEDCDDVSIIDFKHIEEVKADYPHCESSISPNNGNIPLDWSGCEDKDLTTMCMVVEYYHKPTRYLPNGVYVKFAFGCILEMGPYPYNHKKLPIVFDTDIDVIGEITGRPFTANIERLQRLHDMVMTSMARGYAVSASPKWVYPKGAIDPNKLNNSYSNLEYSGPVMPQLVSFNGINQSSEIYAQSIEKHIEKQSSVYGISRGEPPKGVKAAVALQFLDEQELQRESRGMAKRRKRILDVNRMILQLMQQYYVGTDGRMLRMIGEENEFMIKDLRSADFSKCYDVRFENAPSLPDSKSGKIAAILDINMATQEDPFFKREEIAQLLELGNDKRFKNQKVAATKSAQYKLGLILSKKGYVEPRDFDDFFVEYPIFISALQQRVFKGEDPEITMPLQNYIQTLEYIAWQKAQLSPVFKMKLSTIVGYPSFFKVPLDPAILQPQMQMPMVGQQAPSEQMGQMNTGKQLLQEQQQVTGE